MDLLAVQGTLESLLQHHSSKASILRPSALFTVQLTSIKLVMPSSHLILCCPLPLLPPILPSIRVFSNESTLHIRWPKYRSFSFSISPSNEHPGLVSSRMDWLNLLSVQGTCKSLLRLCVFGGNTQKRCCVLTASYQVAHNVSLYHNYIC